MKAPPVTPEEPTRRRRVPAPALERSGASSDGSTGPDLTHTDFSALLTGMASRVVRLEGENEMLEERARRLEAENRHLSLLAHTDPLTKLPNRRALGDALARELGRADRGGPLSVAVLDLDGFKAVNDEHGHGYGDEVLRRTAAAWLAELRAEDFLARVGGDEFAIVLPDCSLDCAVDVIDRVRASTREPPGASVGVVGRRPGESAESLLERADRALYAAKRAGPELVISSA